MFFRAYGDTVPSIDESRLLWIAFALFLVIFLPALIREVRHDERSDAEPVSEEGDRRP